jgi:uncharacterized protein (TIGR02466 family)
MQFDILPLFSFPIMKTNIDYDCQDLSLLKYQSTLHSSASNIGTDLNILDSIPTLKNLIESIFYKYLSQVLHYPNCKFSIVSSWATHCSPGAEGSRHKHFNSWMSGVYYPDDSSEIRFYKQNTSCFWLGDPVEYNELNSDHWDIVPRKNDIIIFDSSLEHKIMTNYTDVDRYSIAFNIVPVGSIGYGDSSLNLSINK